MWTNTMKDFIKIHQGNLELLSSGRFHLPLRLDRGMESPRLYRVNTYRELADNFRTIIFH